MNNTNTNTQSTLGILQTRGLGDILIALPIAHYYYQNYQQHIVWPICEQFISHFEHHVPWIQWESIPTDPQGRFFYDVPMKRFQELGVTEILPLYQALTGHPEYSNELYFQHTSFDQYKYIRAGVPFRNKWQLKHCVQRNLEREQQLYDQMITKPNYAVLHLEGSDFRAKFDRSVIPSDWQIVEIKQQTTSIFDWIMILERAQSIVCVDSCIANLVDQWGLGEDRYFIPRSHIGLTPVHGEHWTWIKF